MVSFEHFSSCGGHFCGHIEFFLEIFSNWVATIVRAKHGTKKHRFIFQLDNLLEMVAMLAAILKIYIPEWLPLSSTMWYAKFGYKRLTGLGGVSGQTDRRTDGQTDRLTDKTKVMPHYFKKMN